MRYDFCLPHFVVKAFVRKLDVKPIRRAVTPALAALICLLPLAGWSGSPASGNTSPTSTPNAATEYKLPFGADKPFLPSEAKAEFNGFLAPKDFPTAEYCGKCHEAVHREWRESAHANSFRAPFYLKNVNLLISQKGIEFTRHCEGCHNPVALFTGALTTGSKIDRSFDADGVTCMACHSIAKLQPTSGIGGYVMGVPAAMVKEDGTPIPGEAPYDEILAHPELHRRAVMKDFYRTSEFCAACHKAAVPKQLNGYKWLRAFSVYDEWQQSSWSRQSPLPFYKKDAVSTCQTCHMMQVAAVGKDYPAKDGKIASHRWLGANTAVPIFYGYDEQLQKLIAFLKDGNLAIDIFAMNKAAPQDQTIIAPVDRKPFTVLGGENVVFHVLIQNKKIGHSLVPEQRDFYETWVEFTATDSRGRNLYHSGYVRADGNLDPRAHSYTNRLLGGDGKWLEKHQVWMTRIKAYDNTILPGRTDLVRYQFLVPGDEKGDITVTARVQYRRFRHGYTEWSTGKEMNLPIVTMAEKSYTFHTGTNAGAPAKETRDDLLRWNNYGIALLDQQQFGSATAAFQQVIKIDPTYVDGYTNVGLARQMEGKWDEALKWLQIALQKDPSNARALAFQGVTYRLQYQLDRAIATLTKAVALYPRLRQGRQELAYAYFLKKDYKNAREQYEALLDIDPDDLTGLRYLSAVYGELGLHDKEAAVRALYSQRVDDPGQNFMAQEYWKQNFGIANEVGPYHIHAEYTAEQEKAIQRTLKPTVLWPGDR
jgi:tetratricopeptide (TPR) repeat protein